MSRTVIKLTGAFLLFSIDYGMAMFACTVTSPGLQFSTNIPVTSTANNDTTGTITVKCNSNNEVIYTIYPVVDSVGGSFTPRTMISLEGNRLQYNLYTDSNRSVVWGDGSGGSQRITSVPHAICQVGCSSTVYGRIPLPQAGLVAGTYSSSFVITISY